MAKDIEQSISHILLLGILSCYDHLKISRALSSWLLWPSNPFLCIYPTEIYKRWSSRMFIVLHSIRCTPARRWKHYHRILFSSENGLPTNLMEQCVFTSQTVWLKKARFEWVHTVWFHLYNVQRQIQLICGVRSQVSVIWWLIRRGPEKYGML